MMKGFALFLLIHILDNTYFETLKHLEKISVSENADVVLMGVIPNEVSTKYGYIIPKLCGKGYYYEVEKFKEKPTTYEAESLVRNNALWNCGVFCVSIKKNSFYCFRFSTGCDISELV
ncbi:MAG: sugar phosphate nucleotidyltransferase [Enterocloster sp.]